MSAPRLFDQPRDPRKRGRTRRAFDSTVKALRETGQIEPADDALLGLGRYIFDQLDAAEDDPDESRFTRARLVAEARATLVALRGEDATGADLDLDLAQLFAKVGDTPHPDTPD